MSRVNIIPPYLLTDQHLMAEKMEINIIAGIFKKAFNSKKGIDLTTIPEKYNLNGHHIKFFYNKRGYLKKRFAEICKELKKRNFNINTKFNDTWLEVNATNKLFNQRFNPTLEDYKIIVERIKERYDLKPEWYKFHRKPIKFNYKINLDLFLLNEKYQNAYAKILKEIEEEPFLDEHDKNLLRELKK